jgi:antitoxin PrlF
MLASTLTSKGQTTIPAKARKALGLHPGDIVAFEIKDHRAVISKIERFDYQYHRALSDTLAEWASPKDDESCHDL